MFDVPGSLFEVERAEVIADSDALVKRFVGSKAEFVGQVRLAEENEGEGRKRIHLVVEQETELVKEQRGEEVGLVNDEEDGAAFASHVGEGGAELGQEMEEVVGGFGLQSKEDLAIEGGDGEVRVGKIDEGKEIAVERVSKGAQSSGLTGTDVAGDESRETFLQGKGEATLDFTVVTRGEKVLAGDGFGEGSAVEAVEIIERGHHRSPLNPYQEA